MEESDNGYRKLCLSKTDQEAETPSALLEQIKKMFIPEGETLHDPCPSTWSYLSDYDALHPDCEWGKYNYVNPPFRETASFFKRAVAQRKTCLSIFLIPTRFHTTYFFETLQYMKKIILLTKTVKFVNYTKSLPTSLCLVVIGPDELYEKTICAKRDYNTLGFIKLPEKSTIDTAKNTSPCETVHNHILMNSVSGPLTELCKKYERENEDTEYSVICPARLDNSVIKEYMVNDKTSSMYFFNPSLRTEEDSSSQLINGTMMTIFNEKECIIDVVKRIPYGFLTPCSDHNSELKLTKSINDINS